MNLESQEKDLSRYAFNGITSSSDHLSILSRFSRPLAITSPRAPNLLIRMSLLLNNWIKISDAFVFTARLHRLGSGSSRASRVSICNYGEINFGSFLCCRIALIGVFVSAAVDNIWRVRIFSRSTATRTANIDSENFQIQHISRRCASWPVTRHWLGHTINSR